MPLPLAVLQHRLRVLTPAQYQQTPATPASMGTAGLKFAADGTVAWNEIWGSFCDLAMAGGPPHKGSLLGPGSASDIVAEPEPYRQVIHEICRGITLVTALEAEPDAPGWVRISCATKAMASWLLRAITTENIAARAGGSTLYLPAGPNYRIDRQIKNVITVIAKTTHYWRDHMPASQQWAIADLFAEMNAESPLLQPGFLAPESFTYPDHYQHIVDFLHRHTTLTALPARYPGWIGIAFPAPQAAIDTMRLSVALNTLARREGTTLFLPLNPVTDPDGTCLLDTLVQSATTRHQDPCL